MIFWKRTSENQKNIEKIFKKRQKGMTSPKKGFIMVLCRLRDDESHVTVQACHSNMTGLFFYRLHRGERKENNEQ